MLEMQKCAQKTDRMICREGLSMRYSLHLTWACVLHVRGLSEHDGKLAPARSSTREFFVDGK